jgi:type II secretory pathway pseudopilin PulG
MESLPKAEKQNVRNRESGITLIETMMAGTVLLIGSLAMITLIIGSIATNNRNKMDSTQAMLATSILEQINSTFIGQGTSTLVDCASNTWTVNTGMPNTGSAGASLTGGGNIDFTQTSPPSGYFMNYVVNTPCSTSGSLEGVYDVRWHVDVVGGVGVTNTYMLTVGAKLKNHGEGNQLFSTPVTLRVMSGN